jgi:hypothetical protein
MKQTEAEFIYHSARIGWFHIMVIRSKIFCKFNNKIHANLKNHKLKIFLSLHYQM